MITGKHIGMLALILSLSALPDPLEAATFYIDFASGSDGNAGTSTTAPWKRAPGMTGVTGVAASYTPAPGDQFIFKGGSTWTASYPWTFRGGSAGNPITYTTDRTWFSGAAFTQPVFDDLAAHPGAIGMANATGTGYIWLKDLKFVNCGSAGVANSDKCLVFSNTHDIAITDSTFSTQAWISIYMVFTSPGTYSNFTLLRNDVCCTSGALWFASAQSSTTMRNITYNNNTFHDYASQIGGSVHGDGAWHGYVIPIGDSTQFIDNMQFCNNRFYGDFRRSFGVDGAMTGFFFQEGGLENAVICNNDMSFSPVQANMFDGLIVLNGGGHPLSTNLQIHNNSLANIGTNAMSAALHVSGGYKNIAFKNNILSGMSYPIYIEDPTGTGTTFTSDFNLLNGTSGQLVWGAAFQPYATWRAAGRDTHSVLGSNPRWVSAPGNEHLLAGSPAIGAGTNLSGLGVTILNSDFDGILRGSAWDMGAFKAIGTQPQAPTNFRVIP